MHFSAVIGPNMIDLFKNFCIFEHLQIYIKIIESFFKEKKSQADQKITMKRALLKNLKRLPCFA